jgi:DNA-binding NarL/FixJ family response regulator
VTDWAGPRGIVGRADELARLDAALSAAFAGSGGTVLVAGDAGIGKTRLVGELARRAREAGAQVLVGHCIDLVGAGVPYLALAEAFRSLPGSPPLAELPVAPAGPQRRLALFEQVRATVERAAGEAPLVLVVEDVHWADASTVDLLAFLAHGARDGRFLQVLTFRGDETDPDGALTRLVARLRAARVAEAIELGPLSHADLVRLLDAAAGQAVPAEVAAAISVRSAGNPFFAEELLRAAGRGDEEALPGLVRDVLLHRVGRLSGDARAVLRVAAACRRDIPYRLLAAARPVPAGRLRAALRETVSRHVLLADQAAGAFRFRHALFAEAIYSTLLPGEREDLHARLAVALAATAAPVEPAGGGADGLAAELAHHWTAAHRPVEAFTASLRAAADAAAAAGLAEALAHLERAIGLWPVVPDAERLAGAPLARLLAQAAEHADDTGDGRRAAELVRRAIAGVGEEAEPVRVALLYERLGSYLFPIGDRAGGLAACRRAVDLVPPEPPTPQRVRVLAALGHAYMLSWRHEEASRVCADATAVAAALGEPSRGYRASDVRAMSLCYLGRPDEGLPLLAEACRRTPGRTSPEWLTRPYVFLSDALTLVGRPAEAVAVAREGLDFARTIGQERSVGNVLAANAAEAWLAMGDWHAAAATLTAALRQGGDYWSHYLHLWAAQLATGRGEFEAAHEHLAAGARALDEPSAAPYHAAVAAELALWTGDPAAATAAIDAGLRSTGATGKAFLTVRLCALGLRAEADRAEAGRAKADAGRAEAGRTKAEAGRAEADAGRVGDLLDRATEAAGAAVGITPEAPAWRALAEAEHDRAAGRHVAERWSTAAADWEALGRPYLAAYAHWRHTEALVAAGVTGPAAAEAARRAHDTAVRLGAEPLRRAVESLARRARLRLRPAALPQTPALAGTLGLTAREAEVLHLLALGYTNRDIAAELTISVKTASVHVSHILRKLGVPSRVQAAAHAWRLGTVQSDALRNDALQNGRATGGKATQR